MIIYKSSEEIAGMRRSNQIVARVLSELGEQIRPGVTTRDLDTYAEKRAQEMGGTPAFKGYRGYPASLCTSINEEIVHGIPSSRILQEGDIISLDYGVILDGFYGDAAVTYACGQISPQTENLVDAAKTSFFRGLEQGKNR